MALLVVLLLTNFKTPLSDDDDDTLWTPQCQRLNSSDVAKIPMETFGMYLEYSLSKHVTKLRILKVPNVLCRQNINKITFDR